MLKRLTLAMARNYLPGYLIIDIHDGSVVRGPLNTDIIAKVLHHNRMGHHLTRSAGKGSRIAKRKAMAEAQKAAIEEYYEDPQAETLGD